MIQIIEDDLVTCHIITALLRHLRCTYSEAHTGAEALHQLQTRPIDLVIVDMVLPDMHGLELLREKHKLPHLRDIPVICCTAQADIETVESALGLGAVDFVKKPIAMQSLAGRIQRALDRAPVRWESWRDMSKRLRFYSRTLQPMLIIAQQVLRELDDSLARAAASSDAATDSPDLTALVARARGAALNVGAIRTVDLLDRLWAAEGAPRDVAMLRAALVIETAAFEEAIEARGSHAAAEAAAPAVSAPVVGAAPTEPPDVEAPVVASVPEPTPVSAAAG